MKKLSETLTELGIAFSFPIIIKDANGYVAYCEDSDGFCYKREYDADGNKAYDEDSDGWSCKIEYDAKGNRTYYETSTGYTEGTPRSAKTCDDKVVIFDNIAYKLKAL